jgi:N-acetylmuramoyl-L-alanine amidase
MILKKGSRGEAVIKVQKKLGLVPDGIYGKDTEEGVMRFQENNGLTVDGIVGPNTLKHLADHHNVKPIFKEGETDNNEDLSDPEDEMQVDLDEDEKEPTTENVLDLIELINESDIDRNIKRIIYHCTATSQNATVSSIKNFWKNKLGWKNPGYHIIVKPNGEWTYVHNFNKVSNGVRGYNSTSINVSYIGGIDSNGKALDNRTPKQKEIYRTIYHTFKEKLPEATHHGHNEFSSKACPSFIVKEWIEEIKNGIDE